SDRRRRRARSGQRAARARRAARYRRAPARSRRVAGVAATRAHREAPMSRSCRLAIAAAAGVLLPVASALAQPQGVEILTVQGAPDGGETWSVSLQVLVFMTALSLLPALLITMTSFTRILI